MSINMGHIAAAAAGNSSPKIPGNNVRQITSLYATGRQPSQTQIPIPKKFTTATTLRMGMDSAQTVANNNGNINNNGSGCNNTSPMNRSFVRTNSGGMSLVAAKAQLFQNNGTSSCNSSPTAGNLNNNSSGSNRLGSSSSSSNGYGSHSRNGSTSSNSSTHTPVRSPISSNGGFSSSCSFNNGASNTSPTAFSAQAGLSSASDKWRAKFEDAEKKRKLLLTSSEMNAREAADLQRRLQQLQREHDLTKKDLKDREDKLTQLRTVSERVYKEYDQLKNRYEVETGAMHQAMQKASEWYKQNRELKRRSTAIMQKFIQVQPDGALLDLLADETDAAQASKDEDELEDLRNTVKRLSSEVARLQSELNSARLQEFEAQEAAVTAAAELDEARRVQAELAELRALRDNMASAASLVQKEVAALRQQCDHERLTARRMKSEADKAVKERNVLAHQSSLLAEALSGDDRLLPLLAEVENLKRLLEEERCRMHEVTAELRASQERGDGEGVPQEVELLDERLKIAEEELRHASARAERAERDNRELRERVSQMEKDLEERKSAPPAPPLPPPPPPPPPPLMPPAAPGAPGASPGTVRLRGRPGAATGSVANVATTSSEDLVNAERNGSAVQDMANLLGIPRKPQMPEAIPGGAIDNIINQIKGGRFTLKSTEQNIPKEKKEETPPAVTEMLNILGTLRRRPRTTVNSPAQTEAPRDVAL